MTNERDIEIDGLRPGAVSAPADFREVRDLLAAAAAEGKVVAPIGGRGALHLGNPIERFDLAMDLTRLDKIIEHQADDLVLSVEAGARFANVARELSSRRQWLPVDVPHPENATVGGLVATALSGPSRAIHGSLRDYLIGISVVSPGRELAKAGGMVVKNVSGFDLMRLHHGALGTLGVIVSVNFKVLPMPLGQSSAVIPCESLRTAIAVIQEALSVARAPSAAVVISSEDGTRAALRWDGSFASTVRAAREAIERHGEGQILEDEVSRVWWRAHIDGLAAPAELEIRIGTRPGDVGDLTEQLHLGEPDDISPEFVEIWPALGTVIIRGAGPPTDGWLDRKLEAAEQLGATWRLTRAPVEIKRGRDIWGPQPISIEVMQRLKHEFDPARTLNPGRYCGRL